MKHTKRAGWMWALFLAAYLPLGLAYPAAAQTDEQRKIGARFGLTPEQTRDVYDRVDAQRDEIRRISGENNIKTAALTAIARELGLRNPDLPLGQFLAVLEERARETAELGTRIANLEQQIAYFEVQALREPATQTLERARQALDTGELEVAEAEFGKLVALRSSATDSSQSFWAEAVEAQANVAQLRGDLETADRIHDEADAYLAERSRKLRWNNKLQKAIKWWRRGEDFADRSALQRAAQIYEQEVLLLAPRDVAPEDWATTQNNLGSTYFSWGSIEIGSETLARGVPYYEAALEVRSIESNPREWASSTANLAAVKHLLADRSSDDAYFAEAVADYRSVIDVLFDLGDRSGWARQQSNLAAALVDWADRSGSQSQIRAAVIHARASLRIGKEERPLDSWLTTNGVLGNALRRQGLIERRTEPLEESIEVHQFTLAQTDRSRFPSRYGWVLNNLATAQYSLGKMTGKFELIRESAANQCKALEIRTRENEPEGWFWSMQNLAASLHEIAKVENSKTAYEATIDTYNQALAVADKEKDPLAWSQIQHNLGAVLFDVGELENGAEWLRLSRDAFVRALEVRSARLTPDMFETSTDHLARVGMKLASLTGSTADYDGAATAFSSMADYCRERGDARNAAIAARKMGVALVEIGLMANDVAKLQTAIAEIERANEEWLDQERYWEWSHGQNSLGFAYLEIGLINRDAAALRQAILHFRNALEVRKKSENLAYWRTSSEKLAEALLELAILDPQLWRLEDSLDIYEDVARTWSCEPDSRPCAFFQKKFGLAHHWKASWTRNVSAYEEAISAYRKSLQIFSQGPDAWDQADVRIKLSLALSGLADRQGKQEHFEEAQRFWIQARDHNDLLGNAYIAQELRRSRKDIVQIAKFRGWDLMPEIASSSEPADEDRPA